MGAAPAVPGYQVGRQAGTAGVLTTALGRGMPSAEKNRAGPTLVKPAGIELDNPADKIGGQLGGRAAGAVHPPQLGAAWIPSMASK